jgi:fructose/tagatose bisphosphate aldolase
MPIINNFKAVKEVYIEAAESGIGLPVFCAEDRETLEAILAAALEMSKITGVENLPVIPAWTSRYPGRSQMKLLTACGNPILGTKLMFSDLNAFMDETSPYRKLRVLPHLDHAFPWLDGDVLDMFIDDFASVMCDASEKPFEENIIITSDYVEKAKGRVVVEGAVDEIFEANGKGHRNDPTTVEQAKRFISQTGVDLIVPNVGTEHRATVEKSKYLSGRARDISKAVGKILCIHGTSSVSNEDLRKLPEDGFVKINIYTTLAVNGGQALSRTVLNNLKSIFTGKQLLEFIEQGILSKQIFENDHCSDYQTEMIPKLDYVCNPKRRDAWFAAVRDRCIEFMDLFNYGRFADCGNAKK